MISDFFYLRDVKTYHVTDLSTGTYSLFYGKVSSVSNDVFGNSLLC